MSTAKNVGSLGASPAPPPDWQDHHRRGHVAQFYSDATFLIKALSRFIGTALGAGDSAIVIAAHERRAALVRSLRHRGLDIPTLTKQGRYVTLDAVETLSKFMLNGLPDEALFIEFMGDLFARATSKSEGLANPESKAPRLAVFGEMVAPLWAQGNAPAALRLEQLWNALAETHAFSLHCGYPIKDFYREEHGDLFLRICQEHSGVIPGESYAGLPSEAERLRNITHLQQRAQALENEIAERKRAEQELRLAHDELERRVIERTNELEQKNLQIAKQAEILESTNQGLRQLSARLLRVQDNERRRIARDLHDSTGQVVALLSMNLSALESEAEKISPALAESIAENAKIVNQVSSELRTISYLLHPPMLDEMGLESALRWYVEGFSQRSGIKVSLDLACDFGRLSSDLETAVFRVIQECLTNIHRHSESYTATIRLYQFSGNLVLQVQDQGKGIAPEKLSKMTSSSGVSGVGLRGMRERIKDFYGEFEIASGSEGTQVKVAIPLAAVSAAES
jgi:signal transduction histidine kinase